MFARILVSIVFAVLLTTSCEQIVEVEPATSSAELSEPDANAIAVIDFALEFDGVDDVVYVKDSPSLDLSGSITVEALIFPYDVATDPGGGSRTIIRKGNVGSDNNYGLALNPGEGPGVLMFGVGGALLNSPQNSILANQWQQVAGVYDHDAGTISLYVNGDLVAQDAAGSAPLTNNDPLTMGISSGGSVDVFEDMFEGQMTRVRIWDLALSSAQLRQQIDDQPALSLTGVIAQWAMAEGSGQKLRDGAGANHGKLGATKAVEPSDPGWVEFAPNAVPGGFALDFDGVDDFVQLGVPVITTETFTIEAWVYMEDTGGGNNSQNNIFSQRQDQTGTGSAISFVAETGSGNTTIAVRGNNTSPESSVEVPRPAYQEWHHYAAVVGQDSLILYIDGTLAGTSENTQSGGYDVQIDYVHLGKHRYDGLDRGYLNGVMDEIRIWSIVRTQVEIQQTLSTPLAGDEVGLVAYWRCDVGSGQVLFDEVGVHDGTLGTDSDPDSDDPTWVQP